MAENLEFKSFERRVRLVRFWRGATVGLLFGSLLACAIVGVFRLRGHIAPWPYAVAVISVVSIVWAMSNALRKVSPFELADSLDRRAGLKNRLATALTVSPDSEGLEADLRRDASNTLSGIRPERVYPIRLGRLQAFTVAIALVAATVTMLGNRPIVLSSAERAKLADSDEAASAVERVLKPYEEEKRPDVGKQTKSEVAEMEKLARDLHEGKLDREEALQKANQAVEDAKKLEAKAAEDSKKSLEQAETALQKLDQAGEQNALPLDAAAEIAAAEQAQAAEIQKQIDDVNKGLETATGQQRESLKSQLNSLKRQLDSSRQAAEAAQEAQASNTNQSKDEERRLQDILQKDSMPGGSEGNDPLAEFKGLRSRLAAATQAEIANIKERLKTATGDEAVRLRKKLAELEAQYAAAKKEIEEFNKAVQAAIKALKAKKALAQKAGPSKPMLHTKFTKPMRQTLEKLKAALHKIESGDELSQSESKELEKLGDQMDVAAANAAASGDKESQLTASVLADAARALAQGNTATFVAGACRSALAGLGGAPPPVTNKGGGPGGYVNTADEHNTGTVNHLDKPAPGRGKATPTMVDPLKGDGPSSYIEVRGPASLGARSAIPYRSVLPSYQRKEEAAVSGGKIPKKHLKRVRAYFDSLTGH